MSDPIDRLSGFASSFEGEIMPRTAADARRRGDTIRRRRHALVAAGSAAAVVAVAVPVFAFASGGDDADPPVGPATGGTSGTSALSADNLLADEETRADGFNSSWLTSGTFSGDGQAPFHPCAPKPLTSLGATDVLNREWSLKSTTKAAERLNGQDSLQESVASFADARAAQAAYDAIAGAMPACTQLASTFPDYELQAGATTDVAIPADGSAQYFAARFDDEQDPQGGGYTHVLETGLVVSGDRIAVLTLAYAGQDYVTEEMDQMIPVAAQRLVTGSGPGTTTAPPTAGTSSPPQADPGVTTTIPDDIPIDLDLVDMGSDGDYQAPEHLQPSDFEPLTLCGTDLWPPAHVDALSTWATGPEYSDDRDLLTFGSVDDAVAAVQSIRDGLQGCAHSNGQVVTTHDVDTGYDSVTFSTACPAGGPPCLTVYQATRVGNAVLLTSIYGEYSVDDADHVASVRTDITKNIATHLCVFTADGCSGGSDSVSTEVPLGPDGYGDLTIGMSEQEAVATGGLTVTGTDFGCRHFTLAGYAPRANSTDGYITAKNGLESIFARPGMLTPEGIGIGSTLDELRAAYPDLSGSDGIFSETLDNGNWYLFDVQADHQVSQLAIVAHRQTCFD
ncbi:hypothetical protein [Nocardioides panacisoli]|uniref:Uncharacterized protein n=1 Tax=Nocardioides panacisoli TaxID=627624 RepID=A0ABP7IG77_9ACTN